MKYLGVFVFAVALIWSWNLVHSSAAVSIETHSGIQEKLSELIKETIHQRKPEASEIRVEQMWTEIVSDDKVKAFFTYSYDEKTPEGSKISNSIRGEGMLERQHEDASGQDHWTLVKVKTTNDAIVFEEGLLVTPDVETEK